MNLLFTLFGGMLLTAVFYGALRSLRVGNFWSAVASAGVLSGIYIVYAAFSRPGLDMVAIHLVAYPTVAVVLAQLYDTRRNQGLHWVPRLIVGLFLAASVLFGGLAYISSRGLPLAVAQWFLPDAANKNIHTGFAGVVGHNEEAAKGIGQHLKAEHALSELGWRLEIRGLENLSAQRASEISVQVSDRAGRPVEHARIGLAMGRPGQEPGQVTWLTPAAAGRYLIQQAPMAQGAWVAYVLIDAGKKPFELQHSVEVR